MTDYDLGKVVGDAGATGNGVASVTLIGTSGKVKTYRMTFTDGTYVDYQVTDGSDASVTIVTSWNSTTSNSKVPSEKLAKNSLDNKVDKETGKGLFSGSYTDLSNKPSIPSSSSDLSDGSDLIKKSNTTGLIKNDGTIDSTSYSTFSGSYNDLSNKPSIPSSSSDLSDGSSLVKTSSTSGLIKNDGSIDTTTYLSSLPSHTHDYSDVNVTNVQTNIDYNDYTTKGQYYIWYAQQSGNTNKPTTGGGLLVVDLIPNGVMQRFYVYGTDKKIYWRTYYNQNGGSWSSWERLDNKISTSDIANNLTTSTTGKVLDARQGKALADLIGDAITYINQ